MYAVISTGSELWLANSETRKRTRLVRPEGALLGFHVAPKGIHHAEERYDSETKMVRSLGGRMAPREYRWNYALIYDTITGTTVRSAFVPGQLEMALEERMVDLDFSFTRIGDDLGFRLNGDEQVLFKNHPESSSTDEYSVDDTRLYGPDGRRVVTMDKPIVSFSLIDPSALDRLARRKNRMFLGRIESIS